MECSLFGVFFFFFFFFHCLHHECLKNVLLSVCVVHMKIKELELIIRRNCFTAWFPADYVCSDTQEVAVTEHRRCCRGNSACLRGSLYGPVLMWQLLHMEINQFWTQLAVENMHVCLLNMQFVCAAVGTGHILRMKRVIQRFNCNLRT